MMAFPYSSLEVQCRQRQATEPSQTRSVIDLPQFLANRQKPTVADDIERNGIFVP
jgi:hypothetical protein